MRPSGIIPIDRRRPSRRAVDRLVSQLLHGRPVVLPSETDYALAVDATNIDAVTVVRQLKGRSAAKPLSMFLSGIEDAVQWGMDFDHSMRRLAESFWPGPLTLILPCHNPMLKKLAAHGTVGVRVSPEPIIGIILRELKRPLIATSANPSGAPLSTVEQNRWIADRATDDSLTWARPGYYRRRRPSTVAGVSNKRVRIFREGPISRGELRAALSGGVAV